MEVYLSIFISWNIAFLSFLSILTQRDIVEPQDYLAGSLDVRIHINNK